MDKKVVQPLLYHTIQCLTSTGLNPFKQNFTSKLIWAYTFLALLAWAILNLIQLFYNFQGIESLNDLVFLPATIMALVKGVCLYVNNRKLYEMITGINEAWSLAKFGTEIEEEVTKPHKLVFKMFKGYAIGGYCVIFLLFIPTLLSKEPLMLYPIYEVCDFHNAVCYYPIYFWEVMTLGWNMAVVVLAFEAIFLSLSCHACVGIEMIKRAFREMALTNDAKHKENMKDLINQHNYVLSFIEDLNKFYSKVLLIQFWTNLGSMIFSLYMLTGDSSSTLANRIARYGMLYSFWLMQLVLYCITGTFVIEQSTSIANIAYDVDFLSQHDAELRNALSMIIMRSQKAAKLSIGGMNDLNLDSFVEVIRNSISVYTLLNTIGEDK